MVCQRVPALSTANSSRVPLMLVSAATEPTLPVNLPGGFASLAIDVFQSSQAQRAVVGDGQIAGHRSDALARNCGVLFNVTCSVPVAPLRCAYRGSPHLSAAVPLPPRPSWRHRVACR